MPIKLIWNASASAPIGFYSIDFAGPFEVTDLVAVDAPEPLALDPDRVAACLQALSERERSVVMLSFFADKPADEVGAELAISGGNVRVIRHRALARLRKCLGVGDEVP